jgi:hypothetical protein
VRALCAGYHVSVVFHATYVYSNYVSPLNALALQARQQRAPETLMEDVEVSKEKPQAVHAAAAASSPTQAKTCDSHSLRTLLLQARQQRAPETLMEDVEVSKEKPQAVHAAAAASSPTQAKTCDSHSLRTSLPQESNVNTSLLQESSITLAASASVPHNSNGGNSDVKVNFMQKNIRV